MNYLDIKGLLDIICRSAVRVNTIKEKTLNEIPKTFNIKPFTEEEEAQVCREPVLGRELKCA